MTSWADWEGLIVCPDDLLGGLAPLFPLQEHVGDVPAHLLLPQSGGGGAPQIGDNVGEDLLVLRGELFLPAVVVL